MLNWGIIPVCRKVVADPLFLLKNPKQARNIGEKWKSEEHLGMKALTSHDRRFRRDKIAFDRRTVCSYSIAK